MGLLTLISSNTFNYNSQVSTMVDMNEEVLPFVRFPGRASQERYHNYRTTKFFYESALHILGVAEREPAFHAQGNYHSLLHH